MTITIILMMISKKITDATENYLSEKFFSGRIIIMIKIKTINQNNNNNSTLCLQQHLR